MVAPTAAAPPDGPGPDHDIRQRSRWGRLVDHRIDALRTIGPLDAIGYVVLLAELVVAVCVLARYSRGQWFFFDDWRFTVIEHLGHDPVQTFFLSHNGHWVTLPLLEYRTLFTVFGAASYAPYIAVAVAVHVVICLLLFALARRAGAGVLEAALCVGVAALAGVGVENVLWGFQTTFTGAVAFGLGALLVASGAPLTTRRGIAVGALTLGALMCSGIGLAMLVVVAVATILLGGWRGALKSLWLPVAAYAVWFLSVGRFHRPPVSAGGVSDLPHFMSTGLSAAVGGVTNVRHATPIICIVFLLVVVIDRFHKAGSPDRIGRILAAAGLVGVLSQLVLTGLTRAGLGPAVNASSRYSYVLIMLLFPCFARLVRRAVQQASRLPLPARIPLALVTAVAVAAAYVGVGATGLRFVRDFAANRVDYQRINEPQVLGVMWLIEQRVRFANTVASPTTPIPIDDLRRTVRRFHPPSDAANPAGVLNGRGSAQVVVSVDGDYYKHRFGAVRQLRAVNLSGRAPLANRCVRVHVAQRPGSLLMNVDADGGMITLRTSGHYVDTRLLDGKRHSRKQRWLFPKTQIVYIASTAGDLTLQIFVPAGHNILICR